MPSQPYPTLPNYLSAYLHVPCLPNPTFHLAFQAPTASQLPMDHTPETRRVQEVGQDLGFLRTGSPWCPAIGFEDRMGIVQPQIPQFFTRIAPPHGFGAR